MTIILLIVATVTLASAAIAMALRNLIHSALLLIASWAGIAVFYLWAGAEFVAFAQILVYVGAVSMVVLFAVLLTRQSRADMTVSPDSFNRLIRALPTGGIVLGVLVGGVLSHDFAPTPSAVPVFTVREIGGQLMGPHTAALLVTGVLLTVALLGAVVIAAVDRRPGRENRS